MPEKVALKRIGRVILGTIADGQTSVWDHALPAEAPSLSPELAAIEALLDDERFLQPFVERFASRPGRPTVPIEVSPRLMYVKHRYQLGHETLVKEVPDSLSWRHFCRLSLTDPVPHPTTLPKLTRRFGPGPVVQLNETLLRAAVEWRLLRTRRCASTRRFVEADNRYPPDRVFVPTPPVA